MDWTAIHRATRDNCIREYLRFRHDAWLKAYWRKRALANAREWRASIAATPREITYERAA